MNVPQEGWGQVSDKLFVFKPLHLRFWSADYLQSVHFYVATFYEGNSVLIQCLSDSVYGCYNPF